jgi:sporulation-control protein spo0M
VEDCYVTAVKGAETNFTLTITWTQVSSITIQSINFQDYPAWFRISDQLPLTKWKESTLQPEGTVKVNCRVTVPWNQPEGLVTIRVAVTCPSSAGALTTPGVIYLTVTGKQLAQPGSIPEYMTYVFLGMLLLLCVYAFAKRR